MGKPSKEFFDNAKAVYVLLSKYAPISQNNANNLSHDEDLTLILNTKKFEKQDGSLRPQLVSSMTSKNFKYKTDMGQYLKFWVELPRKHEVIYSWATYEALANFFELKSGMIDEKTLKRRIIEYTQKG